MKTKSDHEHRWVAIRPGYPQKICKCGSMKVGTQTVLLSDFIRYSTPKAPVAEGDLGMNASGRPQFYRAGAVRDVAGLDDIGGASVIASAVFSGGDFVIPIAGIGVYSDVVDGAGFVELTFDNTPLGLSSVRVEVAVSLSMTSPPVFNADNFAQLGFRLVPAVASEQLIGTKFGTSATSASENTTFPCHVIQATVGALAPGLNTIRLTAAANISSAFIATILKDATFPMRMALLHP